MKSDKSTSKTGRPELRYPAPQIAMLVTAMLFVGGCGQREFRTLGTARAPTAGRRSKAELRETLDTFEELALDRMREAATELDELSSFHLHRRDEGELCSGERVDSRLFIAYQARKIPLSRLSTPGRLPHA
ncbi:MAG: hypothetical protein ACYSWO_22740 [Planctomycetota bacterium]|jgi:hypothetical protein